MRLFQPDERKQLILVHVQTGFFEEPLADTFEASRAAYLLTLTSFIIG
jgi:hypothetical protein